MYFMDNTALIFLHTVRFFLDPIQTLTLTDPEEVIDKKYENVAKFKFKQLYESKIYCIVK
jgi:hypothetical protein